MDDKLARVDAHDLYDSGAEKTSSSENKFISIICFRSLPQLYVTLEYYYLIASRPLEKSIEKEMSEKIKHALLTIIRSNQNAPRYFAEQLNLAIESHNHNDISRMLIFRSEVIN